IRGVFVSVPYFLVGKRDCCCVIYFAIFVERVVRINIDRYVTSSVSVIVIVVSIAVIVRRISVYPVAVAVVVTAAIGVLVPIVCVTAAVARVIDRISILVV